MSHNIYYLLKKDIEKIEDKIKDKLKKFNF